MRMRKINFRAWDKRNNKWIHRDTLILTNAGFYEDYREFDDGNSLFDYEYELMQYTGLKDKNGVKIYEGDILKTDEVITKVHWSHSGWHETIIFSPLNHLNTTFPILESESEVIGNIYENPNLLELEC